MTKLIIIILTLFSVPSFGQSSNDSTTCIFITDPVPNYPGGFVALKDFIKKNLKYPKGKTDYVGTVYVSFIVKEDGTTNDFKIVKGLCDICDKNAIEVLKKMPNWIPAMQNDKPTSTKMVVPVKLEL